jgi:diaminopimelate decarboxylase
MHHFEYRDGVMHAESVDLREIAREVGTPFYCYSTATLERHYRVFSSASGSWIDFWITRFRGRAP